MPKLNWYYLQFNTNPSTIYIQTEPRIYPIACSLVWPGPDLLARLGLAALQHGPK
jgi:hypothetical protein